MTADTKTEIKTSPLSTLQMREVIKVLQELFILSGTLYGDQQPEFAKVVDDALLAIHSFVKNAEPVRSCIAEIGARKSYIDDLQHAINLATCRAEPFSRITA